MLDTVLSALRSGDYAAADTAARQWLTTEPNNPQAHHLLGVALQARGELEAADSALAQAIALVPERADLHVARALLSAQRRDGTAARAGLDHAVTQDPNQIVAYLSLAQLALARSDLAEADRQLRIAERINPDHPHLLALHGQLLLARGQSERALALLTQVAQRVPDDALVQSILGLALLARGRHGFAEQALRNALALQPNATALRHALLRALLLQNRSEEAAIEVGMLLRETPNDAAALALQGQLAQRAGDVALARASFERSLHAFPHPPVLHALEKLYDDAGSKHELIALLDAVLATHPTFDAGWAALLGLARGDGTYSAALAERWYTASASTPAAELLAQVCEARGEYTRAATLAREAVAHDATRVSAQLVLARGALRDGDAAAAVARLQPLAANARDDGARRALLGWLGQALDAHRQHDAAASAWREGQAVAVQAPALPGAVANPALVDAALERAIALGGDATAAGPTLLWGVPGSSAELAASLLRGAPSLQFASDRFSNKPRQDGFALPDGIDLFPATIEGAAQEFVANWHDGLAAAGIAPESGVDWLPHLDSRVLPMLRAAAPGTRVILVLRDPRDLLLNWLAFGSPQRLAAPDVIAAARWLAATLDTVASLRERQLLPILELRHGLADGALADAAAQVQDFLGLATAPDTAAAARLRSGPLGLPTAFPDGHWRDYAGTLSDAFAPLHDVAVRLGYPAA